MLGKFPEIMTQRVLVGTLLVGRLGVRAEASGGVRRRGQGRLGARQARGGDSLPCPLRVRFG